MIFGLRTVQTATVDASVQEESRIRRRRKHKTGTMSVNSTTQFDDEKKRSRYTERGDLSRRYYGNATYNAAFERCIDIMARMIEVKY